MSTVAASSATEKQRIFEMVLSSPGMSERCKIVLQLSRQNILLLARLLEAGLEKNDGFRDELIGGLPSACAEELKGVREEILAKGNLTDFYERLKAL